MTGIIQRWLRVGLRAPIPKLMVNALSPEDSSSNHANHCKAVISTSERSVPQETARLIAQRRQRISAYEERPSFVDLLRKMASTRNRRCTRRRQGLTSFSKIKFRRLSQRLRRYSSAPYPWSPAHEPISSTAWLHSPGASQHLSHPSKRLISNRAAATSRIISNPGVSKCGLSVTSHY